jgi:small-conductance mechanosensitive channel
MVAAALFLGGFSAEGFLLGRDLRSEEQQQQQRGGVVASRSSLPRRSGAAGRGGIVGAGAAAEASAAATAATNHHKNPLHLPLLHHNHHPTHYGTHQIGSHTLQTTLAGRIWPVLRKTLEALHPTKLKTAAHSVLEVANWQGVVFLLAVAYGTVPLTRMVWERSEVGRHLKSSGSQEGGDDEAEDGDDYDVDAAVSSSFPSWSDLKRRHAAEVASGLARVALTVYGVDVACVALTSLGFAFPSRWQIPTVFSKVAYAGWGLRTFLRFKTAALCRIFKVSPEAIQSGRLDLLNRTLTAVSVGLVSLLLLDWLSIRMGVALKGLLTLGSVGTLAFSLASKDLVSQFISGVFLSASSKVYKGDDVLFGDGTRGTIVKLGFVDTVLRSGDNYLTSVPNSKLANQKVSNLSRVRISQVAQTLRFHYEDADEIPALLETIKKEIREACPRLIADGSRPFRVFWTGFKEDHLEGECCTRDPCRYGAFSTRGFYGTREFDIIELFSLTFPGNNRFRDPFLSSQ